MTQHFCERAEYDILFVIILLQKIVQLYQTY